MVQRGTLRIVALCSFAWMAAGCGPSLPRADPARGIELSGLGPAGKRLEPSLRATESACTVEEQRLRQGAAGRASTRKAVEVVLALAAGGLAVGSAIYAGLDPSPKGYVVVPLSAGAAALSVPLGVMIATDEGAPAVDERQQRIRDRRLAVRDAYQRLVEAISDRERSEAAFAELDRALSDKRLSDARRQIEAASAGAAGASAAAVAALDAAKDAALEPRRAEMAYARQRERDAERALTDALLRLGEVCGQGAPP